VRLLIHTTLKADLSALLQKPWRFGHGFFLNNIKQYSGIAGMTIKNTSVSYGSVSRFLHWLIFLLILGLLVIGYLMDGITDKALRAVVINMHKLTGLLVLLLVIVRIMWSLINVKPGLSSMTPRYEKWAEKSVHYLLYVVMSMMPVSGWVMASAKHPPMLGDISLGLPVPQTKALKDLAFDFHYWIAIAIIVLVSVHVFAALYHHFLQKDDVLRRMWPGKH
jgi:cytochrome b561